MYLYTAIANWYDLLIHFITRHPLQVTRIDFLSSCRRVLQMMFKYCHFVASLISNALLKHDQQLTRKQCLVFLPHQSNPWFHGNKDIEFETNYVRSLLFNNWLTSAYLPTKSFLFTFVFFFHLKTKRKKTVMKCFAFKCMNLLILVVVVIIIPIPISSLHPTTWLNVHTLSKRSFSSSWSSSFHH